MDWIQQYINEKGSLEAAAVSLECEIRMLRDEVHELETALEHVRDALDIQDTLEHERLVSL